MSNANPEKPEGEWIEWGGGDQPVADDALVEVRDRDGYLWGPRRASFHAWCHEADASHFLANSDIIAYRVVTQP